MANISLLPEHLINLIAAGEVVERPASVVKELIENSLDAGATKIVVKIEDSGTKLIQVEDNGSGMDEANAKKAFLQHSTSKIKSEEDLAQILSFGFRGEALASISSVAEKSVLETKKDKSDPVIIVKTKTQTISSPGNFSQTGTTVSVFNLFEHVPARKKFLKKTATELKHIVDTFIQTALPHIDVHFELFSNNSSLQKLTKVKSLKDRIFELTSLKTINNLSEATTQLENIAIQGFIGNSFIAKNRNLDQFIFINGRYIKSGLIAKAIKEAYRGFMHTDLQPTYFLFIQVAPNTVDVNIHPRKLEVRFDDEAKIYKLVFSFVRNLLEKAELTKIQTNGFSLPTLSDVNKSEKPKAASLYKDFSYSTPKKESVKAALDFTKALYSSPEKETYSILNDAEIEPKTKENLFDLLQSSTSLMQVFSTYIVAEHDNALYFIDQHAAAEKVLFEKLLKTVKKIVTRPLLVPEIIEFRSFAQKTEVMDLQAELAQAGLVIADFSANAINVLEVPELASLDTNIEALFFELLDSTLQNNVVVGQEELDSYNISESLYLRLATIACHGSIRAGQRLSLVEMSALVKALASLAKPGNCPHGRPILWTLPKAHLEKEFNRDI